MEVYPQRTGNGQRTPIWRPGGGVEGALAPAGELGDVVGVGGGDDGGRRGGAGEQRGASGGSREEGGEPLTAKMAGNIVRDSLRLQVQKAKGRYQVRWEQAKIDALVGYYGLADNDLDVEEEPPEQQDPQWEEG